MPQNKSTKYWLIFIKDRPGLLQTLWETIETIQNRDPNRLFGWDFSKYGFEPMGYCLTEEN